MSMIGSAARLGRGPETRRPRLEQDGRKARLGGGQEVTASIDARDVFCTARRSLTMLLARICASPRSRHRRRGERIGFQSSPANRPWPPGVQKVADDRRRCRPTTR